MILTLGQIEDYCSYNLATPYNKILVQKRIMVLRSCLYLIPCSYYFSFSHLNLFSLICFFSLAAFNIATSPLSSVTSFRHYSHHSAMFTIQNLSACFARIGFQVTCFLPNAQLNNQGIPLLLHFPFKFHPLSTISNFGVEKGYLKYENFL